MVVTCKRSPKLSDKKHEDIAAKECGRQLGPNRDIFERLQRSCMGTELGKCGQMRKLTVLCVTFSCPTPHASRTMYKLLVCGVYRYPASSFSRWRVSILTPSGPRSFIRVSLVSCRYQIYLP